MKNILIITGIYPPDIGGPSTFTKNLSEFINDSKYNAIVITLSNIENSIKKEDNLIKNMTEIIFSEMILFGLGSLIIISII